MIREFARHIGRVESSFDAWIKYYRQDENAPNSVVSYYQQGALIGLALDLTVRAATRGKRSLDDVMRQLWNAPHQRQWRQAAQSSSSHRLFRRFKVIEGRTLLLALR
jgi:predicted metalloprotease with PDZ domain